MLNPQGVHVLASANNAVKRPSHEHLSSTSCVYVCACVYVISPLSSLTSFLASLSAPAFKRSCTISVWPLCEAIMSALMPHNCTQREGGTYHRAKREGKEKRRTWETIRLKLGSKHVCVNLFLSLLHSYWPPCLRLLLKGAAQLRCDHCTTPEWALCSQTIHTKRGRERHHS